MKHKLIAALACAVMLCLTACSGSKNSSEAPAIETTTATTETTAATTAAVSSAVTTTTYAVIPLTDYTEADGLKLELVKKTLRDSKCTFKLTNTGKTVQSYDTEYRLVDAATGAQVHVRNGADEVRRKKRNIAPGESKEIKADWSNRYGRLESGEYYYELLLSMNEQTGQRRVVRAKFTIEEVLYTPVISVEPDSVTPKGLTLIIKNTNDVARSYGLVYRIYETEGNKLMMKQMDNETKLAKNYHIPQGGVLTLKLNWSKNFGALLDGNYAIEIDLLADGDETARVFRTEFTVAT